MPSTLLRVGALALLPALSSAANAQCSIQKRAPHPNPSNNSFFGGSTAVDGDYALVGAHLASTAGAVYAYRRTGSTWPNFQTFTSSSATGGGEAFGVSIAMDERVAAIGGFCDDYTTFDGSGVVYVYERLGDDWEETARLSPLEDGPGRYFGYSVALEGDRLVVGANAYLNPEEPSAAFVFDRVNGVWEQTQRLQPDDGTAGDRFGTAVAVAGDRILVGAPDALVGGVPTGAVYVFDLEHSTWTQTAKLSGSGAVSGGLFGIDLALSSNGKRALIGAPYERAGERGAAYVFEKDAGAWVQSVKLVGPMSAPGDHFGFGTSLGDDLAIVGAPSVDHNVVHVDRGSTYVFRRLATGEWLNTQTLIPTTIVTQEFGLETALSGDTLWVGARRDFAYRGSAYAIQLGGDLRSYCIASTNSTGVGCTIGWSGSTSLKDNDFELTVANAPPNRYGLFAYGSLAREVPFQNGYSCIGGSIVSLTPAVMTDSGGSATYSLDFPSHPAIEPGTTWYFQFAYDDPAGGGTGANLSDGLCATFCP